MTKKKFGPASFLRKLGRDEDGSNLLYFTIMLPVIVGVIGLVLDGGALLHLHSDQQELADASAIAGAAELDGNSDAITRATDKAQNLLNNDPRWSNVALSGVQINTPTSNDFYSSLNPPTVATGPANAHFMKITTVTRQVRPTFLPAVGGTSTQGTSARAVAGRSIVACNVQPLMLCNPFEPSDFSASPGQVFNFVPKGGGGSFSPGDFGLVDAPDQNSGAGAIRDLLSQQSPQFCFTNRVSPRPGQLTSNVNSGIDIRFDITPTGNPTTPPFDNTAAPNVIKGLDENIASASPPACKGVNQIRGPSQPNPNIILDHYLPDPASWQSYGNAGFRIGTGIDSAAAATYWSYHHGSSTNLLTGTGATRFAAYCQELGLGSDCQGTNTPPPWQTDTELAAPHCTPVTTISDPYKRRIVKVAIVNCQAQNVQGNSVTNLVSNMYAEFFLIRPASIDNTIYAEFVRTINPGNSSDLHLVVQLYGCPTC